MKAAHPIAPPRNEPVWTSTTKMPTFPALSENTHADVCIVGAGISGLSAAYMLAKAGKSVVVLDDGPLGGGMTSVTTAHLTCVLDRRYFDLQWLHGEEGSRMIAESHMAAVNRIEEIARLENIECDFERLDGYLFLAPDSEDELLESEYTAAAKAGISDIERLSNVPAFDSGPCLRFPNQAQFHPLKYAAGLARVITSHGGRIFAETHVNHLEGGKHAKVEAAGYTVTCDAVIVATNSPINDMVAIHTKQAPYMTYVIGAKISARSVTKALYWDTEDPFHYVRIQSMPSDDAQHPEDTHDLLIVGGEDHKSGQARNTRERHARLEQWARQRFPMMEEVEFTWAGQVMETVDGVAFIGRNPLDHDNVYIVTGDSGMGMTHGTIGGMLLTDMIQGRENPWQKLYDPSRVNLRAIGQFSKEALNVAFQYADWLTRGDVPSTDEIVANSGAVMRKGLTKVAVYRDENGKLHEFSAVCKHLGCIVQWNSAEKTWDCPCHGSRFSKLGEVMNGPANENLSPAE